MHDEVRVSEPSQCDLGVIQESETYKGVLCLYLLNLMQTSVTKQIIR